MFTKQSPNSSTPTTTPTTTVTPTTTTNGQAQRDYTPAPAAEAQPARRATPGPRVASLIAEDITLEGAITGEGELHIDGVVRGDVAVARLTIGETGQVEGSVKSESCDVRGKVIGAVTARQVRLFATGHMDGDVTHDQLTIESGAFFQGRAMKLKQGAAPMKLEAKPEAKIEKTDKVEKLDKYEKPAAAVN